MSKGPCAVVDKAVPFFRVEIKNGIFLSLVLLYVLFSLDIVTTTMVLSLGGYEVNTVMVGVVGNPFLHLILKGLVLVIVGMTAQWSEMKMPSSGLLMVFVLTVWYSFVILNNTMVLIALCGENCPFPISLANGIFQTTG